jgi:coenzyme PQQ precursor peptide PqqA
MQWTKPEFREISLGGEMTAYVNTDARVSTTEERDEPRADVTEPREVLA